MDQLNVYEAKTRRSELLNRTEAGEEIIIARAGRPVARLIPYARSTEPRRPGAWRDKVHIADDFDDLPDELSAAFRGEGA